jgi:N5-(cytidine 5'-diphosphoramidyl)-L-glutamine hydrolase
LKALITQRESTDMYGVKIDILESTYISFFEKMNLNLNIVSNYHSNIMQILDIENFDLVILTGGGDIKAKFYSDNRLVVEQVNRDKLEICIIEYAIENNIPILAICRGMQYINGIFGGKVSSLKDLYEPRNIGCDHPIVLNNEIIKVNNYHNDGIFGQYLSKEFETIALDKENKVVEAYYSHKKRILGIQWHPERPFSDEESFIKSKKLILNFIEKKGVI